MALYSWKETALGRETDRLYSNQSDAAGSTVGQEPNSDVLLWSPKNRHAADRQIGLLRL